jgi:quinol monooxygenase YgiN
MLRRRSSLADTAGGLRTGVELAPGDRGRGVRSRLRNVSVEGGNTMAVLVRMTAAGMDEATYDQVSAHLESAMKQQPGFIMHVAYPTPDGFDVTEVWESRAQFDTWFNENVKPNVPAEIQPQVADLHAVVQP